MARLVALHVAPGPAFVEAVSRCWDAGDAVAPIGPDLPDSLVRATIERLRPHAVITDADPWPHTVDADAHALDDGDGLVVTSSGSTGEPKVLVHTRAALEAHAAAVNARLRIDPTTDRWLACLPLHHLGGFGVVARSLLTHTPVDVVGFDPATVTAAPVVLGSTLVSLVPTTLDRVDASGFRRVLLGGAADWAERPDNVVRTYGSTETGGGVIYDGLPLDGVEVRVDGHGELHVRSATLARGQRDPQGRVTPVVDDDGWYATGDLGEVDPQGRVSVTGRVDDLIITGGENVWPEPVAEALRTVRGVADAAVVGAPDPTWGEVVVALVVPADAAAPPSLEALRAHAKEQFGAAAAPRRLVLVDHIPRTSLGKIDRAAARRAVEGEGTER